MPFLVICV